MKHLLLLAFINLVFITNSIAQQVSKFTIGVHANPNITKVVGSYSPSESAISQFGLNAGVSLSYNISNKFAISSGMDYNMLQLNLRDYSPTLPCDFNGQSADAFNSYFEDEYRIDYFGIPVSIRHKVIDKRISLYYTIGVEALFKISENKEAFLIECMEHSTPVETRTLNELNSTLISPTLGFGVEFYLSEKVAIFLQPNMSITLNSPFSSSNTTLGLSVNNNIRRIGFDIGARF